MTREEAEQLINERRLTFGDLITMLKVLGNRAGHLKCKGPHVRVHVTGDYIPAFSPELP
jgi:hypothetical protein